MLRSIDSWPNRQEVIATYFLLCLSLCTLTPLNASSLQLSHFDTVGYVQTVDSLHNKITFSRGATNYVVDAAHAFIHIPAMASTAGETGDLVVGMRVEVVGIPGSGQNIRASRISVLPYVPPTSVLVPTAQAAPKSSDTVTVTGVYDSVDASGKNIVLKVNGHAQIVHIFPTTAVAGSTGNSLTIDDLTEGDTVKVVGAQGEDGTLDASSLTSTQLVNESLPTEAVNSLNLNVQIVTGYVSSEASILSRDIHIQTQYGETKVNVPRGSQVSIDGRASSVHDLKKNMPIEVTGILQTDNSIQSSKIIASSAE